MKYPDTRHFLSGSSIGVTVSVADFLLANEVLYWRITYWPSGAPAQGRGVLLGFELPGFHFAQRLPRCAQRLDKVAPVDGVLEEVGGRFPAFRVLPLIHQRQPRLGRLDGLLLRLGVSRLTAACFPAGLPARIGFSSIVIGVPAGGQMLLERLERPRASIAP